MFILIFLAILGFVSSIIWAVDFYMMFSTWYSRIKIGRYKTVEDWIRKSERIVKKWIKKTPTVKKKDNSRYVLIDMLRGEYRSNTIQSWQEAGLLVGLEKVCVQENILPEFIEHKSGTWKNSPQEIDFAMLAFQFLKTHKNPLEIKPAMDEMIRIIDSRCQGEFLWYRTYDKNHLYVDTVGLACPFLVLYGKIYGLPKYMKFGLKQIKMYMSRGLLENYAVPCHAYDVNREMPLGVYGWGRGFGWLLLGVIESYSCLDKKEIPDWLEDLVQKLASTVLEFQHEDGGLGSNLAIDASYDSSITAIGGYYLMNCYKELRNKQYFVGAQKAMNKLMSVTKRNGVLDLCQGDTKGIGLYSCHYDIMPFAQGIALALAKMIEREFKNNEF